MITVMLSGLAALALALLAAVLAWLHGCFDLADRDRR